MMNPFCIEIKNLEWRYNMPYFLVLQPPSLFTPVEVLKKSTSLLERRYKRKMRVLHAIRLQNSAN